MNDGQHRRTRRIDIDLARPALPLWAGIRPTLVIGGVAQPTQWGRGTWQVSADEPAELGVFLFARGWRFGDASIMLHPDDPPRIRYRAPALPFGTGNLVLVP